MCEESLFEEWYSLVDRLTDDDAYIRHSLATELYRLSVHKRDILSTEDGWILAFKIVSILPLQDFPTSKLLVITLEHMFENTSQEQLEFHNQFVFLMLKYMRGDAFYHCAGDLLELFTYLLTLHPGIAPLLKDVLDIIGEEDFFQKQELLESYQEERISECVINFLYALQRVQDGFIASNELVKFLFGNINHKKAVSILVALSETAPEQFQRYIPSNEALLMFLNSPVSTAPLIERRLLMELQNDVDHQHMTWEVLKSLQNSDSLESKLNILAHSLDWALDQEDALIIITRLWVFTKREYPIRTASMKCIKAIMHMMTPNTLSVLAIRSPLKEILKSVKEIEIPHLDKHVVDVERVYEEIQSLSSMNSIEVGAY